MPFGQEFYRRRFEDAVAEADADGTAPIGACPEAEVDLLAVTGDVEFIRQAYRFYLQREPDIDGVAAHQKHLETFGRLAVMHAISTSQEYRRLAPASPRAVSDDPSDMPDRADPVDPDSPADAEEGQELANLLEIPSDRTFVTAAFRRTLGRPPDPDGLEHYMGRLRQGDGRMMVIGSLAASPEAAQSGRRLTWNGRLWRGPSRYGRIRAALLRALPGMEDRRRRAGLELALRNIQARLNHLANQRQAAIGESPEAVAPTVATITLGIPGRDWPLAAPSVVRAELESGRTRRFQACVKPGMVVADVGAGIGCYSLLAARLVGPGGLVFSFERGPHVFEVLKYNVEQNRLLHTGRVNLRLTDSGMILDEALAEAHRVDVIKIDAEGDEPTVWGGMARTIVRNPQLRILMAFAPSRLRRAGHHPGEFLDRLAASGFEIRRIDDEDGTVLRTTRDRLGMMPAANLLLTRIVT